MIKVPERDWKIISVNKQKYLDKLCNRFNEQLTAFLLNSDEGPHKKYIKCWELLRNNDKFIIAIFDEWKRSRFFDIVAGLIKLDLIGSESGELSIETKDVLMNLYGIDENRFSCPF